ncbi:31002_t:CDS:2, partial [Racocetra persica]
FEVNYYSEQYNQALTFARVFINICNTNTYCKIFKLLFHYIKKLTDQLPTFYHIHNSGWKCIIGDLDQGQAKGLGLCLEEIDNSKNWEEHLQAIFKTCLIHFN